MKTRKELPQVWIISLYSLFRPLSSLFTNVWRPEPYPWSKIHHTPEPTSSSWLVSYILLLHCIFSWFPFVCAGWKAIWWLVYATLSSSPQCYWFANSSTSYKVGHCCCFTEVAQLYSWVIEGLLSTWCYRYFLPNVLCLKSPCIGLYWYLLLEFIFKAR